METRTRSRVVKAILAAIVFLLVLVLLIPLSVALVLKPMARQRVVDLLEKRFDRVELERLDIRLAPGRSLFPRIAATGGGLSVSIPNRPNRPDPEEAPPFITMNEFEVDVGLLGLMADPIRVRSLRLDELRIQIPPKRKGDAKKRESPSSKDEPPPVFVIEELMADGAVLRILRRDPKKEPLQFDLHELRVLSAGVSEPMRFEALLQNPKPPGKIETKGEFGPLVLHEPGESPVSGDYVFANADLSDFKGIGGILYSEGRFGGVLERIEVSGFTETPDFVLTSAGNPVSLKTEFEAIVDGTNGNTLLTPVAATLGGSRFRTEGGVTRLPGEKGKTVCVDAESEDDARIEDFLRLAMKAERPFMTGGVRFRSMILIPPGKVDVVEKLVLDGRFAIDSGLFPEAGVQDKVDKLSDAGTGKDEEPAQRPLRALREERVFSDIRGAFALSKGVMTLRSLSFTVPGAAVTLEGTYKLPTAEIDFNGELRLDSKLSDTTTGIKSFLLKLIDPLFKKDDAGAVIPIKISGKADKPAVGLDIGRVLKREEVTNPVVAGDGLREPIRSCAEVLGMPAEAALETSLEKRSTE